MWTWCIPDETALTDTTDAINFDICSDFKNINFKNNMFGLKWLRQIVLTPVLMLLVQDISILREINNWSFLIPCDYI